MASRPQVLAVICCDPMRVMLDTNIYRLLVADATVLQVVKDQVAAGKVTIITTHTQVDQLAAIPDTAKREAVLSIPTEQVSTTGAMSEASRRQKTEWPSNETNESNSLAIGMTALVKADALVTHDKKLTSRVKAANPNFPVWRLGELLVFLTT